MSDPNNQDTPVAWMVDRYWHDGSWLDREVCLSKPGHLDRDSRLKKRVSPLCSFDQIDRMRERAERAEADHADSLREGIAKIAEMQALIDDLRGETEEDRRERKLEAVVAPDNGTAEEVLTAVLRCAYAWFPEARIIGNVRAGDIARAVEFALTKLQDTSHADNA